MYILEKCDAFDEALLIYDEMIKLNPGSKSYYLKLKGYYILIYFSLISIKTLKV